MKKVLLNCDQVFEVLTRGPFPTGQPIDDSVEQHLLACHECRQLAEALQPAVTLLHEAVAADEALCLPEYHGALATAAVRGMPGGLPPRKPSAGARRRDRGFARWQASGVKCIAASLLVALLSALVFQLVIAPGLQSPENALVGSIAPVVRPAQPQPRGLVALAALGLPRDCLAERHRPRDVEQAGRLIAQMAAGELDFLNCCTRCHHAAVAPGDSHDEPSLATARMVAVAAAQCHLCHRSS